MRISQCIKIKVVDHLKGLCVHSIMIYRTLNHCLLRLTIAKYINLNKSIPGYEITMIECEVSAGVANIFVVRCLLLPDCLIQILPECC